MTWSNNGLCGSITSKISGTGLTLTCSNRALNAGEVGVLLIAGDNLTTVDAASSDHLTVTDSAGNNWTKQYEYTNGDVAGDGCTISVWTTIAASTIPITTGTVSISFLAAITAKAATLESFSIQSGNSLVQVGLTALAEDAADASSLTISGLDLHEQLFLRAVASERNVGSFTPTTNYTAFTSAATSGGGGRNQYGGVRGMAHTECQREHK